MGKYNLSAGCPFCVEGTMLGANDKNGNPYLGCNFCNTRIFMMLDECVANVGKTRQFIDQKVQEAGSIEEAFIPVPSDFSDRAVCFCCSSDRAWLRMTRKGRPYLSCPGCSSRTYLNSHRSLTGYRILAPSVYAAVQSWSNSKQTVLPFPTVEASVPSEKVAAAS